MYCRYVEGLQECLRAHSSTQPLNQNIKLSIRVQGLGDCKEGFQEGSLHTLVQGTIWQLIIQIARQAHD